MLSPNQALTPSQIRYGYNVTRCNIISKPIVHFRTGDFPDLNLHPGWAQGLRSRGEGDDPDPAAARTEDLSSSDSEFSSRQSSHKMMRALPAPGTGDRLKLAAGGGERANSVWNEDHANKYKEMGGGTPEPGTEAGTSNEDDDDVWEKSITRTKRNSLAYGTPDERGSLTEEADTDVEMISEAQKIDEMRKRWRRKTLDVGMRKQMTNLNQLQQRRQSLHGSALGTLPMIPVGDIGGKLVIGSASTSTADSSNTSLTY